MPSAHLASSSVLQLQACASHSSNNNVLPNADDAMSVASADEHERILSEREERRKRLTGVFSVSSFDLHHREDHSPRRLEKESSICAALDAGRSRDKVRRDREEEARSATPPYLVRRRLSGLLNISAMQAALEDHEHDLRLAAARAAAEGHAPKPTVDVDSDMDSNVDSDRDTDRDNRGGVTDPHAHDGEEGGVPSRYATAPNSDPRHVRVLLCLMTRVLIAS